MPSKTLAQIRGNKANISDIALNELNAEGFPDFMVNAFLQTAEATNTIVSSRLPGGAGLDLMEANYDLKGFQIKAKSCDWGPMAGFICQLPFLNKYGYKKINYNLGYIIDYLKALDAYNSNNEIIALKRTQAALDEVKQLLELNEDKLIEGLSNKANTNEELVSILVIMLDLQQIETIHNSTGLLKEAERAEIAKCYTKAEIVKIFDTKLAEQDDYEKAVNAKANELDKTIKSAAYRTYFEIKDKILKVYARNMGATVTQYKLIENNKATWSGENTIPSANPAPFIELKRRFEGDATSIIEELKAKNCRHLKQVAGKITGTAFDKAAPELPSILVDFMLMEDAEKNGLWSIYFSSIKYLNPDDIEYTVYDFSSLTKDDKDESKIKNTSQNKEILTKLGIVPKEDANPADVTKFYAKVFQYIGKILTTNGLEKVTAGIDANGATVDYYPLCGFMNPHPPYKLGNSSFYKNAVSGDFDLFAFWPHRTLEDVTVEQLRMSEIRLVQDLKLFLNLDQTFGIEFIPGFSELSTGGLKEDAETGNISGLGGLVAGMLNMFSDSNYMGLYGNQANNEVDAEARKKIMVTNRAFHSDEGGRPGIMEIEFPIAIFFPATINTKALNNEGPIRTALQNRPYIKTRGGLIKNVEELLQLIVDINFNPDSKNKQNAYKIMLHSEWMIHLFYVSLPGIIPNSHKALLTAGGLAGNIDMEAKQNKGKVKEFKDIIEHHAEEFGNEPSRFDLINYTNNLKIILRGEKGPNGSYLPLDNAPFESLRARFINLAFEGSNPAAVRKDSVRNIWPGTPVMPYVAN